LYLALHQLYNYGLEGTVVAGGVVTGGTEFGLPGVVVGIPGLVGCCTGLPCGSGALGVVESGGVVTGGVVAGVVVCAFLALLLGALGLRCCSGVAMVRSSVELRTLSLVVVPGATVPGAVVVLGVVVVPGLVVVLGVVVVGVVVLRCVSVCAEAIPNASIAATERINFFILSWFLVVRTVIVYLKLPPKSFITTLFHTN
jgi:hypothetical protein